MVISNYVEDKDTFQTICAIKLSECLILTSDECNPETERFRVLQHMLKGISWEDPGTLSLTFASL